jgi:hypothetical protein
MPVDQLDAQDRLPHPIAARAGQEHSPAGRV